MHINVHQLDQFHVPPSVRAFLEVRTASAVDKTAEMLILMLQNLHVALKLELASRYRKRLLK